jgi:hypothetical protein
MKHRTVIAAVSLVRVPAAREFIIPAPGFTLRRYDQKKLRAAEVGWRKLDLITAQPELLRSR